MLRPIVKRLRNFLRSELDLQNDRLLPQLYAGLIPQIAAQVTTAARAESRFTELGWKSHVADGKTYVSGLEFTFDSVAHAHILRQLEFLAVLVRDLNAKLALLPDGQVEAQLGDVHVALRAEQDAGALARVFRDEIYLVESGAPMFVWDVGANAGIASLYFADVLGWEVAAYEPSPAAARAAEDNIARSGMCDRVVLNALGVGGKSDKKSFPKEAEPPVGPGRLGTRQTTDAATVEVEIRDAVEVLEEVRGKASGRPILAKLDCGGAEAAIIDRLSESGRLRALSVVAVRSRGFGGSESARLLSSLLQSGFLVRRPRRAGSHLDIVYATRMGD